MASEGAVEEFERAFAKYSGVRYAVAVSSGTVGLKVAMMALGFKPADEIVTTPLTHISTANVVLNAGGIPMFADIGRDTLCLDPESVEAAVTKRTRCVLGVHLYGYPLEVGAYKHLRRRGVAIVEDAAQALGASRNGRMVGMEGDLAVFSFYETRQIGLGEGGMITTENTQLAERCRMIRLHGQRRTYYHTMLGYNFRLPKTIAERGIVELPKLRNGLDYRRGIAKLYIEHLRRVDGVLLQDKDPSDTHQCTRHRYSYKGHHVLGGPLNEESRAESYWYRLYLVRLYYVGFRCLMCAK